MKPACLLYLLPILLCLTPASADYRPRINNNYYAGLSGPFAQRAPNYGLGTTHTLNIPATNYYANLSNNFNGNFATRQINYNPILTNGYVLRVGDSSINLFMNNGIPGLSTSSRLLNNGGVFFNF